MGRTVLTDAAVRRTPAPVGGRRLEVWDAALPGFGLRITDSGHRSFVLLTRLRGRPIRVTLGAWPATTLKSARERARKALDAAARGDDPREPKKPARAVTDTLAIERVAAAFVEKWAKPRNRTWQETQRQLDKYVAPRWRHHTIREITRADVVALVDAVAEANGPVMANRVLATIKKLFAWSLDRGLIDVHPVARLSAPSPERARDRVLSDSELSKLWKAWLEIGYPWGHAMRLLLLTAARRGEVEAMTWDEVDLAERLWTVPTERVKVKLPLLTPLSGTAVALLRDTPSIDGCSFVFSTRGVKHIQDWSGAVARATEESGVTGWRIHDLRRTVRTGLSRLGIHADISERVLGHVIPGVRAVYDRHDYLPEKRDALERWAVHLTGLAARDA